MGVGEQLCVPEEAGTSARCCREGLCGERCRSLPAGWECTAPVSSGQRELQDWADWHKLHPAAAALRHLGKDVQVTASCCSCLSCTPCSSPPQSGDDRGLGHRGLGWKVSVAIKNICKSHCDCRSQAWDFGF